MTMEQEIQRQVREVDSKVNLVDQKVNTVDSKVDKILMVLTGNSYDKEDNGLIGQVNSHDERLEKLEKRFDTTSNRGWGIIVGLAVPAGVGIREIIALIFKH